MLVWGRQGTRQMFPLLGFFFVTIHNIMEPTVLGSARTGLIFTGLQEGAQPGGLTPPGQTEPGIPYHVPSCWVPVGGTGGTGTHLQLRRP